MGRVGLKTTSPPGPLSNIVKIVAKMEKGSADAECVKGLRQLVKKIRGHAPPNHFTLAIVFPPATPSRVLAALASLRDGCAALRRP